MLKKLKSVSIEWDSEKLKNEVQQLKKKRNSRATTILDYDDLLFLLELYDTKKQNQEKNAIHYDTLKEKLNMSHNAFLTHQRRLLSYELVNISQPLDDKERFSGKKLKYIYITDKGIEFLKYLGDFKAIQEGLNGYQASLWVKKAFSL